MSGSVASWLGRVGGWPLLLRSAVLLLVAAVLCAAMLPVARGASDGNGVIALAVAGAVCLLGMLLALVTGDLLTGPKLTLHNFGLGMMFRMGIPLGTCLVAYATGGRLAEGGLAHYMLVYYPVLLMVEIGLTLGRNQYLAR